MGYFALVRLAQVSQAGVYFLMPLKDGVVMWLEGKRADVLSVLQARGADEQEYEVDLGAAKTHRNISQWCECCHSCVDTFKSAQSREEEKVEF